MEIYANHSVVRDCRELQWMYRSVSDAASSAWLQSVSMATSVKSSTVGPDRSEGPRCIDRFALQPSRQAANPPVQTYNSVSWNIQFWTGKKRYLGRKGQYMTCFACTIIVSEIIVHFASSYDNFITKIWQHWSLPTCPSNFAGTFQWLVGCRRVGRSPGGVFAQHEPTSCGRTWGNQCQRYGLERN
jgi:hypothetical protein